MPSRATVPTASTCHVRLAGPQGLKDQLQFPDSHGCLFPTAQVRLQDHFEQANSYQRERRVTKSSAKENVALMHNPQSNPVPLPALLSICNPGSFLPMSA